MKKKKVKIKKLRKTIPTSQKLRRTSKQKFVPYGDRIILKPFLQEKETVTSSGIIIPETVSKEKPEQGTVVAVGEGKWENGKRVPLSVKVGDKVVFSKYGYDEVKLDGEGHYILREENILAIINN